MLARPWYKSISLELCCSVRWVLRLSWPAVTSTHPDTVTTALSRLPVLMDGQNTNPILSCALNPLSIQRLRVAETLRSSLLLFEDLCPVFLLFSRVFSFTFCPQRVKSSRRMGCHVPVTTWGAIQNAVTHNCSVSLHLVSKSSHTDAACLGIS